jgi:hypothetical protein
MALDPFTAIAGPESSYGNNLYNPSSSATGIFQDIHSTWTSAVQAIGLSPSQYPTAAQAPPSVQFAANAYLYNTQGFQPWTIGDSTLSNNIASAGGTGAFAQPGTLSTNPADYAYLDQPGALQNYFSSGGSGGLSVSQVPLSSLTGQGDWSQYGNQDNISGYPTSITDASGQTLNYDPSTGWYNDASGNAVIDGSTAIATNPDYNTPAGGGPGGSAEAPGVAGPAQGGGTSISQWWQNLTGEIENLMERGGLAFFGAILIAIALWVMMSRSQTAQNIQRTVAKAVA